MLDFFFRSENVVHVAALFQLVGFAFRDQIVLRALIICGSLTYIVYYLLAPDTPLWGGVFWSTMFSIVNLLLIFRLVADRRFSTMSAEESRLYRVLEGFSPGEFRKLLALATWTSLEAPTTITEEGRPLDRLYFLVSGSAVVRKGDQVLHVSPPLFVGEVAFLLDQPASATVVLEAGSRVVSWSSQSLHALAFRSPTLRLALSAALNRDMARKVARPDPRPADLAA